MVDAQGLNPLRIELEEEARTWRIRCAKAEAEVRALKKGTRHADARSVDVPVPPVPPLVVPAHGLPDYSAGVGEVSIESSGSSSPHSAAHSRIQSCRKRLGRTHEGVHNDDESPGDQAAGVVQPGAIWSELREAVAEAFENNEERPKVPHGTVTHDELLELEASDRAMHAEEVMALRISLKEKDEDLAQLKRDMHEDMVRELEQAQLAEEGTEMYAFELDCMTERAEHLAAQVTESRQQVWLHKNTREELGLVEKCLAETEARHEGAILENDSLRKSVSEELTELDECRRAEASVNSECSALRQAVTTHSAESLVWQRASKTSDTELREMQVRVDAICAELADARREHAISVALAAPPVSARSHGREDSNTSMLSGTTDDHDDGVKGSMHRWWQGRHKIAQHLGALRSMLLEFQRELRSARPQMTGGRRQNPADSALLARIVKHVEKTQQHVEAAGSRPNKSFEAEPILEERRGNNNQPLMDFGEVKLLLSENRLVVREEVMAEYHDDLDDIVRRNDAERRQLRQEVRDLRSERDQALSAELVSEPMTEIRLHFETQVNEMMNHLSDVHERYSKQKAADDHELQELRHLSDDYRRNLAETKNDFAFLSTLYDKERREHLGLKELQRNLELRLEAVEARDPVVAISTQTAHSLGSPATVLFAHESVRHKSSEHETVRHKTSDSLTSTPGEQPTTSARPATVHEVTNSSGGSFLGPGSSHAVVQVASLPCLASMVSTPQAPTRTLFPVDTRHMVENGDSSVSHAVRSWNPVSPRTTPVMQTGRNSVGQAGVSSPAMQRSTHRKQHSYQAC